MRGREAEGGAEKRRERARGRSRERKRKMRGGGSRGSVKQRGCFLRSRVA